MVEERSLEEFFEHGISVDKQELLSRRRFLTGAVAGGAAGLAMAAGTGVAVRKVSEAELLAARQAAETELQSVKGAADAELEAANVELARLVGLLDLYEQLEKVGLDAILMAGMAAVALPLKAVETGAKALKSGLDWAEDALLSVSEALPTAQESLLWLEAQVSAVAGAIERFEDGVSNALDRVADNAVGEAVRGFAAKLLDSLPFGLGEKFRDALDGLVALVTSVDELVEGINTHLLEPLREGWFSDEEGKGLRGLLVDPLVEHVLDPAEAHLVNLSVMADNWQSKLADPTQEALTERAKIREEIARYREEHGLT
jgi:hypothetical protein